MVVPGGEGARECNMTGRCPFFKNLDNLFLKKFAFQYTVSEIVDYKTIAKTIVYCSSTDES